MELLFVMEDLNGMAGRLAQKNVTLELTLDFAHMYKLKLLMDYPPTVLQDLSTLHPPTFKSRIDLIKYRNALIKMKELRHALLNRTYTPLHPYTHQV
ncbi:hypothetical protein KY284_009153 [Solanum tuberosum]|nr:hypothetical protein KY284_009153 [Solanum tuberosum]